MNALYIYLLSKVLGFFKLNTKILIFKDEKI